MKKNYPFLCIFLSALILPAIAICGNANNARKAEVADWMKKASVFRFIENKGQMTDMQHKADADLLFKVAANSVDVYITTTGLSYMFYQAEKHKDVTLLPNNPGFKSTGSFTTKYCRADMNLIGAEIKKENIEREDESEDRTDYYLGGICPNGILNVHSYGKVTIKNVYPGIDWVLYTGAAGLEYDFIIHPGADAALIKLRYNYTDKPMLQNDGSIKIHTPMGDITEGTPRGYAGSETPVSFTIQNNEISFHAGTYDKTKTLTIDPPLVWATFYASAGVEDTYCLSDDGNDIWISGWTLDRSFATFNAGGGAYFMDSLDNSSDLFILEFNTAGVLKWATFYGGGGLDGATSIFSDGNSVWVTGYTESGDFPIQNPGGGAYYDSILGPVGSHIFILKFTTGGVRKWATYYGTTNNSDNSYSIQSDGTNVWVTGEATSTNFPTYNPGGGCYYQSFFNGAPWGPFILQFSTSGVLKWATLYGTKSWGTGQSIWSDGTNVWLTGSTTDTIPTLNPGGGAYFQGALGGSKDAFIAKFNTTGVLRWATYFGGSASDYANSINSDGKHVWVTGVGQSANFPLLNPGGGAYYQSGTSFTGDAFVSEFDTAGVLKWSTYYGGLGSVSSIGTCIQSEGRYVWVTGTTTGGLPVYNPGGSSFFQGSINPGDVDIFMLQFDTAGVRKWATYYGYNFENEWSALSCDAQNVFVSDDDYDHGVYPHVDPGGGAYYDTMGVHTEIVFVAKFCVNCNCVLNSVIASSTKTAVCPGDTITLSATPVGTNMVTYKWTPGGQTTASVHTIVDSTTTYKVTVTDTAGCSHDATIEIIVKSGPVGNVCCNTFACPGDTVTFSATSSGINTYKWMPGGQTTSSIHIPADSTTTYTVTIKDSAGCYSTTKVKVTLKPIPLLKVCCDTSVCPGDTVSFSASSTGSNLVTYKWTPGGQTTSSIRTPADSATVYTVKVTDTTGCKSMATVKVAILPIPVINVCCDSSINLGQQVQLISSGGQHYLWSPPLGLNCDTCPNPVASPAQTTTYTLTIRNDSGCVSSETVTIDVLCGEVFVPSAFSPNNDGQNDVLYLHGKCINTMDFIIYDRWGNKVFESDDINIGWDGKHKDQAMNTGTYVYYLQAVMLDGTALERKGNISLIR